MASRRAHPSEPRHGLSQRPLKPNAPIPPTSGNNQPLGQEVHTRQPMGHPPDTKTGHTSHIPNEGGHIRQPPHLLHGARHYLLYRIPGGLILRGTPRRLQLPPNMLVYRKPGIRPRRHEEGDSTRPRLVHGHNYTLLGAHGASRMVGYPLVLRSDTEPPQPENTHPGSRRTHAICLGS